MPVIIHNDFMTAISIAPEKRTTYYYVYLKALEMQETKGIN
jgi:hypothetical protein